MRDIFITTRLETFLLKFMANFISNANSTSTYRFISNSSVHYLWYYVRMTCVQVKYCHTVDILESYYSVDEPYKTFYPGLHQKFLIDFSLRIHMGAEIYT